MPRRRSKNPSMAISITLPMDLLQRINDKLPHDYSRSTWIATACRARLTGLDQECDHSTRQLMAMLHARVNAYDEILATLLYDRLQNPKNMFFTSSSSDDEQVA